MYLAHFRFFLRLAALTNLGPSFGKKYLILQYNDRLKISTWNYWKNIFSSKNGCWFQQCWKKKVFSFEFETLAGLSIPILLVAIIGTIRNVSITKWSLSILFTDWSKYKTLNQSFQPQCFRTTGCPTGFETMGPSHVIRTDPCLVNLIKFS